MNDAIEQLLYKSGLTAQGCWDELDDYAREAIMTLIQQTADRCAQLVQDAVDRREPASTYPDMIRRQFDSVEPAAARVPTAHAQPPISGRDLAHQEAHRQGHAAQFRGWERRSPYRGGDAEKYWLAGYDGIPFEDITL
jgi:hypothetical protein